MGQPLRIALTTGDPDGIGTEVVSKALYKIKPQKGVQFYLWRTPKVPKKHLALIDRSFIRKTVSSWPEALLASPNNHKEIIDINSNLNPTAWVELCAEACRFGHIDGIATGPLSKTTIINYGATDIGHTEIFSRITKTKDLFMGFIGKHFCVVLATGHIPLRDVSERLTRETLRKAILAADSLRLLLPKSLAAKPIAVLGLNPHSGEQGIIGSEETDLFGETLQILAKNGVIAHGPLVPDAAFQKANWKQYSVFVATYHDQGLIPFKSFHGHDSGVHITLGLPFVRTSVDHGTAKELFGKNKADPGSMIDAINWAIKLCRQSIGASANENS